MFTAEAEGGNARAAVAPPVVKVSDAAVKNEQIATAAPWERAVELLHAHTCASVDDSTMVGGAISGSFLADLEDVSHMDSDASDFDTGLACLDFAEPVALYEYGGEQDDGEAIWHDRWPSALTTLQPVKRCSVTVPRNLGLLEARSFVCMAQSLQHVKLLADGRRHVTSFTRWRGRHRACARSICGRHSGLWTRRCCCARRHI